MSKSIIKTNSITKEEIVELLASNDDPPLLFKKAADLRNVNFEESYEAVSTIKISNYCEDKCYLCEDSKNNSTIKRYRMTSEEIIETARQIINHGLKTIILQSGIDTYFDSDLIAHLIYSIKDIADSKIILNLGAREMNEYISWKIAGADGYILRVETFNRELFSKYISPNKLNRIIKDLDYLSQIGFKTGSGLIVGFPDQSFESIAADLIKIKNNSHSTISLQPFKTIQLENKGCSISLESQVFKKIVAVCRLLNPKSEIIIPAEVINSKYIDFNSLISAGVNKVEIDFTPSKYFNNDSPEKNLSAITTDNSFAVNSKFFKDRINT